MKADVTIPDALHAGKFEGAGEKRQRTSDGTGARE